jgi:excisionase family DNA binding protein
MTTLLNAAQVARILGCSKPHVRKLWDSGALPGMTIPARGQRRMRRIRECDLDQWIAKQHTVSEQRMDAQ